MVYRFTESSHLLICWSCPSEKMKKFDLCGENLGRLFYLQFSSTSFNPLPLDPAPSWQLSTFLSALSFSRFASCSPFPTSLDITAHYSSFIMLSSVFDPLDHPQRSYLMYRMSLDDAIWYLSSAVIMSCSKSFSRKGNHGAEEGTAELSSANGLKIVEEDGPTDRYQTCGFLWLIRLGLIQHFDLVFLLV
jgi:hypothetical protein